MGTTKPAAEMFMSGSTLRARVERSIDPDDIVNRLEELEDRLARSEENYRSLLKTLRAPLVAAREGS